MFHGRKLMLQGFHRFGNCVLLIRHRRYYTTLNICLVHSFFVYNNTTYKQIHGCAMGSPVSAVVANLCMEVIEEQTISNAVLPPKIWKRFVDDSFAII